MNLANLVLSAAAEHPDSTAIVADGRSLTYSEFVQEGTRVSAALEDMGVTVGDRVMLFAENCLEYLVIYHAVVRLGAIFTPVHASFQVNELEYVLDNARPAVIFAQGQLWRRLERCSGVVPVGRRVTVGAPPATGTSAYDAIGRGRSTHDVVELEPSSPALICYTSGTTDRPHPVTRSHSTEIWNARTYMDVWDYMHTDRALVALPLSWVYGLTTLSQGLLAAGSTIVLHTIFSADSVIDEIQRSSITLLAGTMSMYVALLQAMRVRDLDLPSLRHVYRGGEPAVSDIVDALEHRLGLRLSDGYAATEVAPVLAVDPIRHRDAPPGTAGRLVPGARIRIVDQEGHDVQPGEVGEAWLSGPGLMLKYWNEPALTAQRVTDGWFHSGDLLREGEGGYYFVIGRSSEIIIRNGARIAPAEVEAALTGLPGVADSVAVGIPDDEFGESIAAFVILEPGCIVSADDIYVYLSDRIARFKLPSDILFVDEFPTGPNAKRDRKPLRTLALLELRREFATDPPNRSLE